MRWPTDVPRWRQRAREMRLTDGACGSLAHLATKTTETGALATGDWFASHVRSCRQYTPPKSSNIRPALRKEGKELTGHYYQLLAGHAATGACMANIIGKISSSQCSLCGSGDPQSRAMWKRVGKACGWKHSAHTVGSRRRREKMGRSTPHPVRVSL